jgi:hypothetical protein
MIIADASKGRRDTWPKGVIAQDHTAFCAGNVIARIVTTDWVGCTPSVDIGFIAVWLGELQAKGEVPKFICYGSSLQLAARGH